MKPLLIILAAVSLASCAVTRDVAIEVLQQSQLTATGYVKGDSACTEISVYHPLIGHIPVYSGCVALKPADGLAKATAPTLSVSRPIILTAPVTTGTVKLNENEADGIPE